MRRPLEHGQVGSFRRQDRDRLDTRRPGADDRDALSGKIDFLMRPMAGVIGVAPIIRKALDIRYVRG